MDPNPILDFGVDKTAIQYIGSDLQRPECILAERDGTLWAADARGGVVRLSPEGRQQVIARKQSIGFAGAASETARYLDGTLPNAPPFDAARTISARISSSPRPTGLRNSQCERRRLRHKRFHAS